MIKRKKVAHLTADIETITLKDGTMLPIMIAVYDSVHTKKIHVDYADINEINIYERSNNIIDNFLKYIESNYDNPIIYFHNLSSFDGILMIHQINCRYHKICNILYRDGKIYQIKVPNLFTIRDSYLLIPLSLKNASTIFNTYDQKKEFDYSRLKSLENLNANLIIDLSIYIESDVKSLYQVLISFEKYLRDNLNISIYDNITLSSASIKLFINKYYKKKYGPFISLNENHDNFIRKGYLGGICDIYIPYINNGYLLDINSMYPYIMSKTKYGIGKPMFISKQFNNYDDIYEFSKKYVTIMLCMADVSNTLEFPPITIKHQNRIIQPVGKFKCYATSDEIIYYYENFKNDIKLEIINGIYWERSDYIFNDYISDLYKLRIKYKEENNKSGELVIKRIMNACYGRFGIKTESETLMIGNKEQIHDKISHIINNKEINIKDVNLVREDLYTLNYSEYCENNLVKFKSRVDYSAITTAAARIHLNKLINFKNNIGKVKVYYCDTDSIVVDDKSYEILKSESLIDNIKLGYLKEEKKIKRGIFIAPKCYILEGENTNIIKIKGIPHKNINNFITYWNTFTEKLKDKKGNITLLFKDIEKISKNIKMLSVKIKNMNLNLSLEYNKRVKLYKEHIWVKSSPIELIYNNIKLDKKFNKIKKRINNIIMHIMK